MAVNSHAFGHNSYMAGDTNSTQVAARRTSGGVVTIPEGRFQSESNIACIEPRDARKAATPRDNVDAVIAEMIRTRIDG